MQQKLIIYLLYSVFRHLHLSRILYKSAHFLQNKPNFPDAKMNSINSKIMAYKNFIPLAGYKNKPNQTQNKPNTNPIAEMPKINLSIYSQTAYINKTSFRRIQNKPNSNPIKPNLNPVTAERLSTNWAKENPPSNE